MLDVNMCEHEKGVCFAHDSDPIPGCNDAQCWLSIIPEWMDGWMLPRFLEKKNFLPQTYYSSFSYSNPPNGNFSFKKDVLL